SPGGASLTFPVPATTPCGHFVQLSTAAISDSVQFQVVPCVQLSTTSAPPGTTIGVTGIGLPVSAAATVTLDGAPIAGLSPAAPTTNASGYLAVAFVVSITPGRYDL